MNKKLILLVVIITILVSGYFLFKKECRGGVLSGHDDPKTGIHDVYGSPEICKTNLERFLEEIKPLLEKIYHA
ncbi:hypothetical protein HY967_05145 [Candidatus Jorgensenbacteria bacterium]|nr:hypothetical protein [Candidatus Jorgensenbacteria bacterium]